MKPTAEVRTGGTISQRLDELRKKVATRGVAVGLPADAGTHPNAGMSYARLGAIHEFGATIQHPGGTKYVVGSGGRARFVSNDYSGTVAGTTAPHTIKIPERSFLRAPLRARQDDIAADFRKLLKLVTQDQLTMTQALNQIGARGASISQEAISAGINPPNTAATERRKGSSTPLMDDEHLRNAITWTVEDEG